MVPLFLVCIQTLTPSALAVGVVNIALWAESVWRNINQINWPYSARSPLIHSKKPGKPSTQTILNAKSFGVIGSVVD